MRWKDYKCEFEEDRGTLRDLYVFDTTLADWQCVLDLLRTSVYRLAYSVDGDVSSLPQNVSQILQTREEATPFLAVHAGMVQINCHFFCEDEIEFDIDPREINDANSVEAIFTFMRQIGGLLDKEAVLTPENTPEEIIFRFQPADGAIAFFPALTEYAHAMRGRF